MKKSEDNQKMTALKRIELVEEFVKEFYSISPENRTEIKLENDLNLFLLKNY